MFAVAEVAAAAGPRVVTYPAPEGEPRSPDYAVEVNGKPVDVYIARVNEFPHDKLDFGGNYSFVQFDFAGTVKISIRAVGRNLDRLKIQPASAGVKFSVKGKDTIVLALERPCRLSIEPDGRRRPLLLFANPIEENAPKPGDPNVLYYGPGLHRPAGGSIEVKSNQTLYVAGGAIIEGAIFSESSENVSIRGRGIISGNPWPWGKGPRRHMMSLRSCRNVTVEGIILRGPWSWTLVPTGCENVSITNVKICAARVNNDDGIDPVNSRHVVVRDCFLRTDDDCIAVKGLNRESGDIDDVQVLNTVLWCDRARVVLLGHESRAGAMRNILFRDVDIVHFGNWPIFLLEPGENMELRDLLFERIRIHGEGQDKFAIIRPAINQYMRDKTWGHVRNVTFKDIDLSGKPGKYHVLIEGGAEKNRTADLVFRNVRILGEPLGKDSMRVVFGHDQENFVEKDTVRFVN
jgi:hypothetical protein